MYTNARDMKVNRIDFAVCFVEKGLQARLYGDVTPATHRNSLPATGGITRGGSKKSLKCTVAKAYFIICQMSTFTCHNRIILI